jgi:NADPH2:quinone reductase
MIAENRSIIGVQLARLARANPSLVLEHLRELFRLYAHGEIKPYIGKIFTLAEAAEAHRFVHDRKNLGKVVLIP